MIYFFLILILTILIFTVIFVNKLIPLKIYPIKYPEIDGLRGYLAFFVFLHHSYIWHEYLSTNKWEEPKSNLFNHFGQSSVSLFFIITAFLFITKILESKTPEFNWNNYIKSRFFRMFPMYFVTVIIVLIIVAFVSNFEQKDSFFNCFKSILSWLFFSINGSVDINGMKDTFAIFSAVSWTLPYEIMFYFLLPLFALFYKIKVPFTTIAMFTLTFVIIAVINKSSLRNYIPFIGGIVGAIFINKFKNGTIFKNWIFTFIAIGLLFILIFNFHSGRKLIPILLSTIIFIIIASGNSFFGLFSNVISRQLGQITYSIYLIHGVVLFIVFRFIIGFKRASELQVTEYWGVITLCIVPIIIISQLTFKYIELPFINFNKNKKL
jgi:peptidoglycan/LPS O-acetylase OafA/YrhL